MTRRITLPAAALALSGCGLSGPPPTGHVEGQVIACYTLGSVVEPICETATTSVEVTLEGAGPAITTTLDSPVFRFTDVEVGSYTLYAFYTGDRCLIVFDPQAVTVADNQTANVVIDGRGRC
ncbi:MAG: hypothetical protein OXN18_01675 [Gemmatimonadota bacterium]|nr:hypothetical protein [Gemmatimonadota bacterium]